MENKRLVKRLNDGYIDFITQLGRRASVNEFAKYLDVPNTSLSAWMTGVREPVGENLHKLAAKLGPDIYDIVGQPRLMPEDPDLKRVAETWWRLNGDTRKRIMELVRSEGMEGEASET